MSKRILYLLSFLLIAAIIAPSVSVLASADDSSKIVMDFSEDENKKENKEEKKEINEKDLLFYAWLNNNFIDGQNIDLSNYFYVESESMNTFDIVLPPPEHTV